MTRDEVLAAFDGIRVWQQGGRRAVHKPLLVLFELGRLARGEPPAIEYNDIEPKLIQLLSEFGPSGARATRHYPFWHLKTDGLWDLSGPQAVIDRPARATPNLSELREHHVSGQLRPDIRAALAADRNLLHELAQRIVSAHFPESIQTDVLEAVGLGGLAVAEPTTPAGARQRDPSFRQKVLLAYEYRCCLCGYDLRLDSQPIGLEAAHIQWFQAGGPDVEQNGLALCSLHHKIFDLGAFTIEPDSFEVRFSRHVMGSPEIQQRLLSYHGAGLIPPQSPRVPAEARVSGVASAGGVQGTAAISTAVEHGSEQGRWRTLREGSER